MFRPLTTSLSAQTPLSTPPASVGRGWEVGAQDLLDFAVAECGSETGQGRNRQPVAAGELT